jgi:hypothetical protein
MNDCNTSAHILHAQLLIVIISSKLFIYHRRRAIRLAASGDTVAPFGDVTTEALRDNHPARSPSVAPIPLPHSAICLRQQESDVVAAVNSFLPGLVGGLDGLRPQHLKDMVGASAGEAGQRLLGHLTEIINLCLACRVPVVIQPVFYGASLCALAKKDGASRPIAVGCTLRSLIAKAACKVVMEKRRLVFLIQLAFGVPQATEAIAHAAC